MGTGYTRNDSSNNIADGNVINASDLDGEFDAVQSAFNGSSGHSHDGSTGEGPLIATAGLADNAVTTAKITDANVTTAKIADANITVAKMAANSINSDQYVDGSIDRVHLAADIVDGTKIADDSINSEHYVDGSIDTAHIADAQVTLAKIANQGANSVLVRDANSSGVVSAKAVGDTQLLIGDGTGFTAAALSGDVTMTNAGAVTIANGAVENAMIAADAITGAKIADDAINSEHYTNASIDAVHIANNSITATQIAADAIGNSELANNAVATANIADDAVTSAKIDTNIQIAGTFGVTGETTLTTHLNMGDNDIIKLGASSDLQIFHDASNSFVKDAGTGSLVIEGANVQIQDTQQDLLAKFNNAGAVQLYHVTGGTSGVKLATSSSGVSVTGNVAVSGTVDGRDVASDGSKLDGIEANAKNDQTITAGNGLTGGGTGDVTVNIGAGTGIDVAADAISVDVSDFMSNGSNNRIVTATGADAMNAESNMTFDGSTLNVSGAAYITGNIGRDTTDYISFSNNSYMNIHINGSNEFRFESDGDFHADANVIAHSGTVSDERLKENIEKIENATDKVSQLNGYTFNYKKDGRQGAGVIAQEVEKVLPSAVMEKELPLKLDDGVAYKIVEYDQIIGLLIESIKELKQEINTLKGE